MCNNCKTGTSNRISNFAPDLEFNEHISPTPKCYKGSTSAFSKHYYCAAWGSYPSWTLLQPCCWSKAPGRQTAGIFATIFKIFACIFFFKCKVGVYVNKRLLSMHCFAMHFLQRLRVHIRNFYVLICMD